MTKFALVNVIILVTRRSQSWMIKATRFKLRSWVFGSFAFWFPKAGLKLSKEYVSRFYLVDHGIKS